jgi:putative ABC transport system substrate-binding protein
VSGPSTDFANPTLILTAPNSGPQPFPSRRNLISFKPLASSYALGDARVRRRDFIKVFASSAAGWPLAARAQQPPLPVIGYLSNATAEQHTLRLPAFRQGLKEAGYVEGQNVAIEYRWAEGHNDRLLVLAAELVRRQVAVIAAAGGTPAVLAAKAATATIPVIFAVAVDPVEIGLVASLNRPGGNVTGVTNLNVEVGPKRLELLRAMVPTATRIALLENPASPSIAERFAQRLQTAAGDLGLQLHVLHASTERDFDTVFATLVQLRADALVIAPDVLFNASSEQLAALTLRHALPAIFQYRPFVAAGGLMSYASDEAEYYRVLGVYTGRVLNGEKPADLPVKQSNKVELIINLRTAKALGLTVPPMLLTLADEVIE